MEVFTSIFRALDSLFMAITIGIASLLVSFNIDFPLITQYAPAPLPPSMTEPLNATTISSTATTTIPKKTTPSSPPTTTSIPVASPVASVPASTPKVAVDYEAVNAAARAALVNILCLAGSESPVGSVSGSGVFIDSRGIILTNAHIAQYYLLKDYPKPDSIECSIRLGSPASAKYRAELLYLPPAWITENADQLKAQSPKGTGEHDYAFLRITGTTDPQGTLPASFPRIPIATTDPEIGEEVLLAAYAAGFLDGTSILRDLHIASAFTVVQKLFTFNEQSNIDAVSIGGTIVSQGGSSGGAVVRGRDGALLGLIATATAGSTTGDRDLRAIMTMHVARSLAEQGMGGLVALLNKDAAAQAADFKANVAPGELEKLLQILTSPTSGN